LWSNIGLFSQGVFSSIGASVAFFFYVWLTLTALLVTATAILIAAVCLKRLFSVLPVNNWNEID